MNPTIQPRQGLLWARVRLTNKRILRSEFASIGVLLVLAGLLIAGTGDRVLNLGSVPSGGTITPFDAPGAGTGPQQGTLAYAINEGGTVAGYYFDSNPMTHGFLRAPNGTFITFDAPGGGTGAYQGTFVFGFNSGNWITGFVRDSSDVFHGYLRAPGRAFTTFDVPGAGTGQFQGTEPSDINGTEDIAGSYVDSSNVNHGFVRAADGTITAFDVPGAGTGPGQGTLIGTVDNLNSTGTISGYFLDASDVYHGYTRTADGTTTQLDDPNAGTGPQQGTEFSGINDAGMITGYILTRTRCFTVLFS
jgi:hypothetical protein